MEFKKLSDVEVIVEPTESANVLIEENGVIKKAPKKTVGGGVEITNAAEVGQTIIVKATDDDGKPVEWESVNVDNLVKTVLTEMGIEKVKINKQLLLNNIYIYTEDGDLFYEGNRQDNDIDVLKPNHILTCTNTETNEISSYVFPEIEKETFVGAEFIDSYTNTTIYKLNSISFPEIIINGKSLVADIWLYYNDYMEVSVQIDVENAMNLTSEDITENINLCFEIKEEGEYLVLNNAKIKNNGVIADIATDR